MHGLSALLDDLPMQSLKPIRSNSSGDDRTEPVSLKRLASAYRLRLNHWLSDEDSNFLLEQRAGFAARNLDYPQAIRLLSRLITYEPERAQLYVNRGLMHYWQGQWSRALKDYNRAIALDRELDKAYSNRGNLYAAQGNWIDAIADFDQAIDLNPLNIRARFNQAVTFREMGDHEDALACFDIALFFRPHSAALHAERGRTYHLRGDWNCAIADYTTALSITSSATHSDIGDTDKVQQRVRRWMGQLQSAS